MESQRESWPTQGGRCAWRPVLRVSEDAVVVDGHERMCHVQMVSMTT